MADYTVEGNRTASATLGVFQASADTVTPRRMKMLDITFGSEATPADNAFLWKVQRVTAAGSLAGTTITASPMDLADAAALMDTYEALTTNPGVGVTLLSIPLNQRATFRWVARPGSELVSPATGETGFIVQTPTSSAVAVTATAVIREE